MQNQVAASSPAEVLRFWFEELTQEDWFQERAELDQRVTLRYGALHERGARGELYTWRKDIAGRLAEVLLLDQFSRNIGRGAARAFAQDGMALCLAQEAIAARLDQALPPLRRKFLYLPYMHSESLEIHHQAVRLFEALAHTDPLERTALEYEHKHLAILKRFGRYPHRNAILGRASTARELEFLAQPDSAF